MIELRGLHKRFVSGRGAKATSWRFTRPITERVDAPAVRRSGK